MSGESGQSEELQIPTDNTGKQILEDFGKKVASASGDNPYKIRTEYGEEKTRVTDVDKAMDMAIAGDMLESTAAYLRQKAKIGKEKHTMFIGSKEHDIKQEELAKKYENSTLDLVKTEYKNASYQDSSNMAEEVQNAAERLEFWAGKIHDNKELAGDMTPQDCVDLENGIVDIAYHTKWIDNEIEKLNASERAGVLDIDLLRFYIDLMGIDQDALNKLDNLTRGNATDKEIKQFVYNEFSKISDLWKNAGDITRHRLAVVQGK